MASSTGSNEGILNGMAAEYVTTSKCETIRDDCWAGRRSGGRWAFGIVWCAVFLAAGAALGFAFDSTRDRTTTQSDVRALEHRVDRVETAIDALPRIERSLDRIESELKVVEHP